MGVTAAQAQTTPAVGPPAVVPVVAAPAFTSALSRADTARAVQGLFRCQRGGGAGGLALGTVGILASALPALRQPRPLRFSVVRPFRPVSPLPPPPPWLPRQG